VSARENVPDNSLDATQSRLAVLYAKQGRAKTFKSKAERDSYLTDEIKSLKAHERAQGARVDQLNADLGSAKRQLGEVTARAASEEEEEEDRREGLRKMADEVAALKKQMEEMQEERKWVRRVDRRAWADGQDAMARGRQAGADGGECAGRDGERRAKFGGHDGQGEWRVQVWTALMPRTRVMVCAPCARSPSG
jgi:structural maintenance of chromosome 3 (chondroitin sulfate proteoglycan 6)